MEIGDVGWSCVNEGVEGQSGGIGGSCGEANPVCNHYEASWAMRWRIVVVWKFLRVTIGWVGGSLDF